MSEPELLPLLSPEEERRLEVALRALFAPAEIDAERHERILALALEDPLAEPSAEELTHARNLRDALEGEADVAVPEEDPAALLRAVKAAHSPTLGAKRDRFEPRLQAPLELATKAGQRSRSGRVVYVAFGAAALLASAAAALVLVIGGLRPSPEPVTASKALAPSLAVSRSSVDLFDREFSVQETTSRIDRIASARERELRGNLYAAWGVR